MTIGMPCDILKENRCQEMLQTLSKKKGDEEALGTASAVAIDRPLVLAILPPQVHHSP